MGFGGSQTAVLALLGRSGAAIETWLDRERDQLAHWPVIAGGFGIASWYLLATQQAWIASMLAASGLAILAWLWVPDRRGRFLVMAAIAFVIGMAAIWLRAERVAAPVLGRPAVVRFDARVARVEAQPAEERTRLTLTPIARPDLPPRVRVNVADADMATGIVPAATVSLRARLMPPAPASVPGSYDFARAAWFQGLGATGRVLGKVRVVAAPVDELAGDRLAGWRMRLTGHIQSALPGSPGGVASAFVTGDRGAIAEADTEAMQRAGLTHLLSISGLHVTAVIGAVMLLTVRLLALSPWLALRAPLPLVGAAAGALAGLAYTLLSGAEVPTIRSCVAALLVLGGLALGREAITMRLVATGALVILLLWPESLVGPSFQLSFAAVTAIVALHEHPRLRALFLRRDESVVLRFGRILLSLLVTGVAVEAALAPIALFHFHRAGVYGSLANTVAIPLTTFVIMPAEAIALVLDLIGFGAPAWWVSGHAIGLLLGIAHWVSAAPGAVAAFPTMPAGAFASFVAGGLWISLWRTPVRRLGWIGVAIGAIWVALTTPADLLVTGDGRHVAIVQPNGSIALLRPRAGDYVRDMLGESAGAVHEATALDAGSGARCSIDFCTARITRDARSWQLLATRSPYLVPVGILAHGCAQMDIVISERRLPRSCRPRWLKLDRTLLARTGGVAIDLGTSRITTVFRSPDDHPWRRPTSVQPAFLRPMPAVPQ
jgi:competence protein ComEC